MTVAEIQNQLFSQYKRKGFLSENEITDCCVSNNLDFFETDEVMQFLIDKKVLFSEKKGEIIYEEEDIYDKAQIDYDEFFDKVLAEYPNFKIIVEHIKSIKPPQHREWKTLIQEAHDGNVYAFNRMTEMYLRGVLRISYNFAKENYCDFEDAFQNGVIGLIQAIRNFDVSSFKPFYSYFPLYVLSELQRTWILKNTVIDLPANIRQELLDMLKQLKKGQPSVELNKSHSTLPYNLQDKLNLYKSNNKKFLLPYENLSILKSSNDFYNLLFAELKNQINIALSKFQKNREILEACFGLNNKEEKTLRTIATTYGVSHERIRQIKKICLTKLQEDNALKAFYNELE